MKAIKHPSLLNLVNQLIERAPEVKSFTANRMDPTMVTIQKLQVTDKISLEVVNSWGSELTIRVGKSKFVELYIDEDGIWLRQPLKFFHMKYMRSIVRRFDIIEREDFSNYEEDMPWY